MDSAQNVATVVREARDRRRTSGSTMGSEAWCQAAANSLRPASVQGSGWMELVAKCTAELDQDLRIQDEAAAGQERKRAERERAQSAQAQREADDYEARRLALLAGLKSGQLAPSNCAQWMVGKG